MDTQTYSKILEYQGIDSVGRQSIGNTIRDSCTNCQKAFRTDCAKGKTAWTGDKSKDLQLYILANHPLISIFFVSADHPFGRNEVKFLFWFP